MQHIKLILIFIALIFGFSLYSYFILQFRRYGYLVIKRLGEYTVIMSLLLTVYLIYLYSKLNLPEFLEHAKSYYANMIFQLVVTVLIVIMIDRLILIYLNSTGRYKTKVNILFISAVILALTLAYLTKALLIISGLPYRLLGIILRFIYENVMLVEIPLLLFFVLNRKKLSSFMRSTKILFLFMLLKYFLFLTIFLPEQHRFLPGMIFMVSLIFLPYLWLKFVFLPELRHLSDHREEKLNFICNKYGISQRESEIILHVLSGKSNKEIEEKLFISGHTVKNHLYSIYQKLKIKSRSELFRLFYN